jgi:hypothetical protein
MNEHCKRTDCVSRLFFCSPREESGESPSKLAARAQVWCESVETHGKLIRIAFNFA